MLDCVSVDSRGKDITENGCGFVDNGVQVLGVEKFLSLTKGLNSVQLRPRAQRCHEFEEGPWKIDWF